MIWDSLHEAHLKYKILKKELVWQGEVKRIYQREK